MIGFLFNSPISFLLFSCGLVTLVIGSIKLWNLRKTEHPETIIIFWPLVIGVIAFLLGIFERILTIVEIFDTIAEEEDISPSLVTSGMKNSFTTLMGSMILIISIIVWGILNDLKQKKIAQKKSNLKSSKGANNG